MSFWTAEELDLLRRLYPMTHTTEIAGRLGRSVSATFQRALKMGLHKHPEYWRQLAEEKGEALREQGRRFGFQPGQAPWNKGKTGVNGVSPTRFKAGRRPHTWVPVGSRRVNKDGITEQKVAEGSWKPIPLIVWEAEYGPIGRGSVVVFRPGCRITDPEAIRAEHLECLTRSELMRRNTIHRYPPELKHAIRLSKKLQRAIHGEAHD